MPTIRRTIWPRLRRRWTTKSRFLAETTGFGRLAKPLRRMVLLEGIELSTSPLPRECSTTELQQRRVRLYPGPAARRKRA